MSKCRRIHLAYVWTGHTNYHYCVGSNVYIMDDDILAPLAPLAIFYILHIDSMLNNNNNLTEHKIMEPANMLVFSHRYTRTRHTNQNMRNDVIKIKKIKHMNNNPPFIRLVPSAIAICTGMIAC